MAESVDSRTQYGRAVMGSAALALGALLLFTYLSPPVPSPVPVEYHAATPPRQHVVIFLVDTSDAFDAHGLHVQSVIQQQCSRCLVEPVNLHGDLSVPSIMQALQHVSLRSQTYDATTTLLVNLSLGTYTYDEGLHTVIRQLDAAGLILIASAGNDNTDTPFYPAAFPEVLGICASTRYTKTKAAYSNFGSWVRLCAPGWQYVSRPLEHGGMASGTSFASPLAAGALGQLLLDAPCASPRLARRALLRTADPVANEHQRMGAGILNATAAGHYLRTLYACDQPVPGFWQRLLATVRRLGSNVATYIGLLVYFVISVFTVPFLLAFIIETCQRRAARRQQCAIQQAYAGTADYRRQRLLEIQQRYQRTHKVRQREQAELMALMQALVLYGEPCWWCDRPPAEPLAMEALPVDTPICSRCGQELWTRDNVEQS